MLCRVLQSERLKGRRSPVWLVFLLLPIFPALLGTLNYLGNLGVLENGWYSLWSQHTIFAASFFMPAQFGVFCAWQWRLEHSGYNWNSYLTAPVSPKALYAGKFWMAAGVSVLAQGCIGLLYLVSGKVAGIAAPPPAELAGWLLFGALGGMAVCAVQLFLSLVLRSFAAPVLLGLLGGIAGLLMTSRGAGLYFPYSLLCLGMRANNPSMDLPVGAFLISCLVYTVVFSALSVCWLSRRDAVTG